MLVSPCQSRSPDLLASIRRYVVQEASKDSTQSCTTHHCIGLLSKRPSKLNIIPKIGRSSIGASYTHIQVIVEYVVDALSEKVLSPLELLAPNSRGSITRPVSYNTFSYDFHLHEATAKVLPLNSLIK